MNSRWKKTTSLLCALTVAAVPMALSASAKAIELDNTDVQIGEAYVEGYILTIPASFDIQNEGWNEIGDISAVGYLAEDKKLVVSADSANHWCLKNEGTDEEINYYIRGNAEGEEVYSWEFNELSETPATRKIGVDVEPFKGKPAGKYTDVLTFTASVETMYNIVDLSTLTEDYEAQDGDILTGTLAGNYKITVADGATITLRDAVINGVNNGDYRWAGITPNGDATIILEGENSVKGFWEDHPGIYVPEGKTLTINGNGSLDASSNGFGAGIGGGYLLACGNIIIESGTITATGGDYAAGIGGGSDRSCGNIIIESGTITATGGRKSAGIGGSDNGSCGNITIANTVTKVTATKGTNAPNSIGAGNEGTCGDVIIGGEKKENISESPYVYPSEQAEAIDEQAPLEPETGP